MRAAVVRTYLEISRPSDLRPAAGPRLEGVEIERVSPPDGAVSRWFYETIGREWSWNDRLTWDASAWDEWAHRVETWALTVRGERAGYFELHDQRGDVEIAYFGLLRGFHGLGLGGHLLTHAIRRGFELGARVWVHTSTLDGPHALANYERRGMRVFKRVTGR